MKTNLVTYFLNAYVFLFDKSINFVNLDSPPPGIYGYPNEEAALVALKTVRKFLEEHGQV